MATPLKQLLSLLAKRKPKAPLPTDPAPSTVKPYYPRPQVTLRPATSAAKASTNPLRYRGSLMDIGDDDGATPKRIDQVQRLLQKGDEYASNTAFGLGAAHLAATKSPLLNKAPSIISKGLGTSSNVAGKVAGGLQSAVWGADAVRSLAEPKYADRKLLEQANRMKSGDLAGSVGYALQHPATGLAGGVKAYLDASLSVKKKEGELMAFQFAQKLYRQKVAREQKKFKDRTGRNETPQDRRFRASVSRIFDEPIRAENTTYPRT